MTNKLIRAGYSYTIPATPYQPARPGYWITNTYTVQAPASLASAGIRTFSSGGGSSTGGVPGGTRVGSYFTYIRPIAGQTIEGPSLSRGDGLAIVYVPGAGASASGIGGGTVIAGDATTYTVSTWVPPEPEIPASPARRISSPPEGWTAYARSLNWVADYAHAEFFVRGSAAGVAIGLAPLIAPSVGYGHIPAGVLLTNGTVRSLRTGATLGNYTSASKIEINLKDGSLEYRVGGAQVATEPASYARGAPLYLSAALYGAGDDVDAPVLTQLFGGSSQAELAPLAAFGGDRHAGMSAARLAGLVASSAMAARSYAALTPLAAFSQDRPGASSHAALPLLLVSSYGGAVVATPTTESVAVIPPLQAASVVLVGASGSGEASISAMRALSADRPYGYSVASVAPLAALGYETPAGLAMLLDDAIFYVDVPLLGTTINDARMLPTVEVDVPVAPKNIQVVELLDQITLDVVFSFTGEALADARDVIWFDVPLDVPGAFMDAWSVNADTGGSSTYDNFAFNSLACIGGRYFGAGESGIFELVGDTDDGQPVRASLDLGLRNFGTSNLKTVDTCFLGMAATGHLYVKVLAEGNEHLYKTRSFSPQMQAQRVVFGRGLRTNYVGLQIFNEGGADFELDGLEFALTDLSRRV